MLLPALLVPSKGPLQTHCRFRFNALEPSLARGPGRVRKTRVFHPHQLTGFLAPGQASHFWLLLFSGAGSSVALLVIFFPWCRVKFRIFGRLFLLLFFGAKKGKTTNSNKRAKKSDQKRTRKWTRKWTIPKGAPESSAESRNLRDHVDVSRPRAFLEGCTVTVVNQSLAGTVAVAVILLLLDLLCK